jgi:hypothetical protein
MYFINQFGGRFGKPRRTCDQPKGRRATSGV